MAKGRRVSWFPSSTEADWPPDLAALAERLHEMLGFVPNLFLAYAARPQRFRSWFAHFRQLHEPTSGLSAAEREMIAVVTSATNECPYCLESHGASLRLALGDAELADRIAIDHRQAGLDDRRVAILDYAVKLTREPTACTEDDLRHLEAVGLSRDEVWDVIELTAMYNFTNRLTLGAGLVPNDEYHAIGREPTSPNQ
jgi:uncharacterized peroxidase-related enzyme